jgi:hypothetical protein
MEAFISAFVLEPASECFHGSLRIFRTEEPQAQRCNCTCAIAPRRIHSSRLESPISFVNPRAMVYALDQDGLFRVREHREESIGTHPEFVIVRPD